MQSGPSKVTIAKHSLNNPRLTKPVSILPDEIESPEPFTVGSRTPRKDANKHSAKSPSTRIHSQQPTPKAGSSPNIFAHLSVPSQAETGSLDGPSSPSPLPGETSSKKIKVSFPKSPSIQPEGSKSANSEAMSARPKYGLFGSTIGPSSGTTSSTSPFSSLATDPAPQKPASGGLFNLPTTPAAGLFSSLNIDTADKKTQGGGLFGGKPTPTAEKQTHTGTFSFGSSSSLGAPSPRTSLFGATRSTVPSGGIFGSSQPSPSSLPSSSAPVLGSTPAATNSNKSGSQFGGQSTAK